MASRSQRQRSSRTSSPTSMVNLLSKSFSSTSRAFAGRSNSAPSSTAVFSRYSSSASRRKLKRRHRAAKESAALRGIGVAGHLVVREPVAQPLFRQLLGLEVMPHGQPAREEHRRHLGRRLADFRVERLGLFDDEHAQLRMIAAQQDRRRRAAEGAAEDDHVVAIGLHGAIVTLTFRVGFRALCNGSITSS